MTRSFSIILTLLFFGSLAFAQTTTLKSAIPGSGASKSESFSFGLKPVVGQAAGGQGSSTTFSLRPFSIQSASPVTSSADPFITSFTPDRGGYASIVTILGGNFGTNEAVVEVLFGTTQSPSISLSSPTQIVAEVPTSITGPANITVTINGSSAVSASQFTIIPPPQIQLSSNNASSFEEGSQSAQLRVDVTHDYTISNVEIRFRALRAADASWQTEDATAETPDGNTTTYFYDLQSGSVDELGVIYTFEVTDEVDNVVDIGENYLYRSFPAGSEPTIPQLSFGGAPENWRMFSIPYQIDQREITQIFGSETLYGAYDNTKWRLVRWNPSKNDFDEVGREITSIEEGKGYWFNAKKQKTISIQNASAPRVTDDSPKSITLQPGWNQIGNPYPFTIDWSDVLQFNGITEGVNTQIKVVPGGTSLEETTSLNAWNGAYVENTGSSSLQLEIPFRPLTGARVKRANRVTNTLDNPHWELNIESQSGVYSNKISRIGMHPEASNETDHLDESRVPRLGGYLDFNFDINGKPYSASMRSTKDYDSWEFTVENNLESEWVQLTWDNSYFGDNQYQLILHDLENEKLVSMRAENSYSYKNSPQHGFRIYYGTTDDLEGKIQPSSPILGQIYPNPFNSEVMINYTMIDKVKPRTLDISIYDIMGQRIKNLQYGPQGQGFYQLSWDSTNHPAGVYLVRMILEGDHSTSEIEVDTRRIIKQ